MTATLPVVQTTEENMDTLAVIARIKTALRKRSGKAWSVTRGRGTSSGWITITCLPKNQNEFGYMSDADCAELGRLLGMDRPAHRQGANVPSSYAHYREFIDRAEGRTPRAIAEAYWD